LTSLSRRERQKFQGFSRRNFREGKPNESETGVSHLIHVFPAEAGIQDNSGFLLDPGLRRGDDEHQNAKVL
jgi:hypothetical protein